MGQSVRSAMWGKTRVNGDTTEINPSPVRSRSMGRSYLIIGSPCCPAAKLSYLLFSDQGRKRKRERKGDEQREVVYGSRLFLLEPVLLAGYSSRQRYRVLTRLQNLACRRGGEIERERVIVTTASSDNRSIRDRSELPAAFPQDRVKRY